jgi:lipid-binding SYLF domain-containing protein
MVLFLMAERGLDAWMRDEVKLSVDAGATVLMIGSSSAEASATTNGDVDVIAWAREKGAYARITLAGSVIKQRSWAHGAYYGQSLSARKIVIHDAGHNKGADTLYRVVEDAARAP